MNELTPLQLLESAYKEYTWESLLDEINKKTESELIDCLVCCMEWQEIDCSSNYKLNIISDAIKLCLEKNEPLNQIIRILLWLKQPEPPRWLFDIIKDWMETWDSTVEFFTFNPFDPKWPFGWGGKR